MSPTAAPQKNKTVQPAPAGFGKINSHNEWDKLVEIIQSPRVDVRCYFGLRASPEIWARYLRQSPEPPYQNMFAMLMRVPGFVLEGDTLVAMQNVRALSRVMNVMRTAEQ